MEFLCEYKRNFMFETYIDNLNYENRKTVSRFRLSNHNLPIEKLRYENIKKEDRLCEICNLHNVGNENHYMLECQSNDMKDIRENFVQEAIKLVPQLSLLDETNVIKYCLIMADRNLQYLTAVYIKNILNTYKLINESKINEEYIKIFM